MSPCTPYYFYLQNFHDSALACTKRERLPGKPLEELTCGHCFSFFKRPLSQREAVRQWQLTEPAPPLPPLTPCPAGASGASVHTEMGRPGVGAGGAPLATTGVYRQFEQERKPKSLRLETLLLHYGCWVLVGWFVF